MQECSECGSSPTAIPTFIPTFLPTFEPTFFPTVSPTVEPPSETDVWKQIGQDIDGTERFDEAGKSVAISEDGRTVAVGLPGQNNNAGQVRVYRKRVNTWIQLGQGIDGTNDADGDHLPVYLVPDGTILAVGCPSSSGGKGAVRVYFLDVGAFEWVQLGQDLVGLTEDEQFGRSVSLSSQPLIIAIGAPFKNDRTGEVTTFGWDGTQERWFLIGSVLSGEGPGELFGQSVSINGDAQTLAVGAPFKNDFAGQVQVYSLEIGGEFFVWEKQGQPIDGKADDWLGDSVELSSDGRALAVGAPMSVSAVGNTGFVAVYGWDGEDSWAQLGNIIYGQEDGDYYGEAMSLSAIGTGIAIGAYRHNDNRGEVRVFQLDASSAPGNGPEYWDQFTWEQVGNSIEGESENDWSGYEVSLSRYGEEVAIGAPLNNGSGFSDSGHFRVYERLV